MTPNLTTDPTIPVEAFDADRITIYPSIRQDDVGLLTMDCGMIHMVSFNRGRTWQHEGVDCGSPDDGSGLWIQPPTDPDPARDPDAISGWWYVDCDSSTPTACYRPPSTKPPFVVHVDDGRDWRDVTVLGSHGEPVGRLTPFDDTPGPDGTGAKSGIQVEVPAEGWPPGWPLSAVYPGYRHHIAGNGRLPDSPEGRIAAWVLEGK